MKWHQVRPQNFDGALGNATHHDDDRGLESVIDEAEEPESLAEDRLLTVLELLRSLAEYMLGLENRNHAPTFYSTSR